MFKRILGIFCKRTKINLRGIRVYSRDCFSKIRKRSQRVQLLRSLHHAIFLAARKRFLNWPSRRKTQSCKFQVLVNKLRSIVEYQTKKHKWWNSSNSQLALSNFQFRAASDKKKYNAEMKKVAGRKSRRSVETKNFYTWKESSLISQLYRF